MADRIEQIMELVPFLSQTELVSLRARLEAIAKVAEGPSVRQVKDAPRKKRKCPYCESAGVKGHGTSRGKARFMCKACSRSFTDLTGVPVSSVKMPDKMRLFAAQMAKGGAPLRQSAQELGINLKTAFRWRHKVLQGYSLHPSRKLSGIAEADETFFRYSEKGDKSVSKRRKAHKRGGKASQVGVSDEQVPVVVGCDRQGEMILGVAGRGRVSQKDIEQVLGNRIDDDATLCTDSHRSFKAFAAAHDFKYKPINISKGRRVVKKIYHIQNVNNAHTRLKNWMVRFDGVATKHLDSYMGWFGLMEEIKRHDDRDTEFVDRSMLKRHQPRN